MIRIPAYSPNIIESKSLKLYLGSFAMTTVASTDALKEMVTTDLRACTGTDIQLHLHSSANDAAIEEFPGISIDSTDVQCDAYDVDASLLEVEDEIVNETLHSNVLRSLCPVTNQPDMGSVLISYRGPRISHAGLLQYIVSFREHNDFHEACVERMFIDILERCEPEQLTVYARYQRRGGIDINPFRSNFESDPANTRLWRQ
jgi:7-cyano-7-deazaguanine reductase